MFVAPSVWGAFGHLCGVGARQLGFGDRPILYGPHVFLCWPQGFGGLARTDLVHLLHFTVRSVIYWIRRGSSLPIPVANMLRLDCWTNTTTSVFGHFVGLGGGLEFA